MITEKLNLPTQAGEDQASPTFVSRAAHWDKVQVGLSTMMRKGWATTPEDFDTETLSNLVIAHDWLQAGDIVYSANNKTFKLGELVTADDIILLMAARAKHLLGEELTGAYPDVNTLHKGILDGALRAWMALCCPPEFFGVENIQPHKLTDGDLDAAARVVIGGAQ